MKKSKAKIIGISKGKIKAAAHHAPRAAGSKGRSSGRMSKAVSNLKGFKGEAEE